MALLDLAGRTYGSLYAIREAEPERGRERWVCWCYGCERAVIRYALDLIRGTYPDCGCTRKVIDHRALAERRYWERRAQGKQMRQRPPAAVRAAP